MIYKTSDDWRAAASKRILLFGMSGLGKTHVSNLLRRAGGWFHYSVDYRIGTRYLGEHIVDNFKRVAMREPFLRDLLLSDSIYIASNITFENLAPLSTFLGKPGDPAKGGLPFEEYMARQELHREAEIAAMRDTVRFIDRARDLYGYDDFVCDTSGSICEVVDPHDPTDPLLTLLTQHLLPVWIEGSDAHTEELIRRFDRAPKPMYYRPDMLRAAWYEYLGQTGQSPVGVDPDAFVRWTYARALAHRQPIYRAMADKWGVTVAASEVAQVRSAQDVIDLVAEALERRR
ncbi:ATPase [Roseitranquillus sediminis]|uniref:ATPase n=1 Tax=Roseitranquillus sediminis TaxID=2809051 RepID=UPI001D0C3D8C|nr:ATPase [Roseitranquillus sediminis]MBM9595533.1 ATPase [Roseitranquillus sediminis]